MIFLVVELSSMLDDSKGKQTHTVCCFVARMMTMQKDSSSSWIHPRVTAVAALAIGATPGCLWRPRQRVGEGGGTSDGLCGPRCTNKPNLRFWRVDVGSTGGRVGGDGCLCRFTSVGWTHSKRTEQKKKGGRGIEQVFRPIW